MCPADTFQLRDGTVISFIDYFQRVMTLLYFLLCFHQISNMSLFVDYSVTQFLFCVSVCKTLVFAASNARLRSMSHKLYNLKGLVYLVVLRALIKLYFLFFLSAFYVFMCLYY